MLDKIKELYINSGMVSFGYLRKVPNSVLYGPQYTKSYNDVSTDKSFIRFGLLQLFLYNQRHTPYGRENFGRERIYEDEVFDIYKTLPITTSSCLRENPDYYKSSKFGKWNSYSATTGGTGKGVTTLQISNRAYMLEWAHMNWIWAKAGFDRRQHPRLSIRGGTINSAELISYNALYNEYVVNMMVLSDDVISSSLDFIERKGIKFLHTYPSNLKLIYEYCLEHNRMPKLQCIFMGSEGCSLEQRLLFKNYFQCQIVHWYGLSEKVGLAFNSDCTENYTQLTSYGYLTSSEISGEDGLLLGSTFVNNALPLIKYSTGDYARTSYDHKSLYLSNVKGRWGKDFVYDASGKRISSTQLNFHHDIFKYLTNYQVVQNEMGVIIVKINITRRLNDSKGVIIRRVKELFYEKLPGFEIEILECTLAEFELTKRGKIKMIVQNLDL